MIKSDEGITTMLTVTGYPRVEMNNKTYDLVWYDNGQARVNVHTKRGVRTLNGRGKANRMNEAAQVIAKAKEERN